MTRQFTKLQQAVAIATLTLLLTTPHAAPATGHGISNIFTINNANPSFHFSTIPDHTFNSPVPVTITAKSEAGQTLTAYSATARLYVSGGPQLDKVAVVIANGVWTGTLSLDSPADSVYLVAEAGSVSGKSNVFRVTSATATYGRIEGRCVDTGGNPITGVAFTVTLVTPAGTVHSKTTNTSTGRFAFANLAPGNHKLHAKGAVYESEHLYVPVRADWTTPQDLTMYKPRRPVLLVPGIMGSSTGGLTMTGPLNEKLDTLQVYKPLSLDIVGWDALTKQLTKKDYTVFVAPWDWRRKINDPQGKTVQWYLKDVIDDIKDATGQSKVDVVAHSLGGLLTRHYIQSVDYRDDIDKFAMVGVPNGGSVEDPYYLWEGGDLDRAGGFWDHWVIRGFVDSLALQVYPDKKKTSKDGREYYDWTQTEVKTTMHTMAPGLQDLILASGSFLVYQSASSTTSEEYPYKTSLLTWKLNDSGRKTRLVPGNYQNAGVNQVRTRLFRSESHDTGEYLLLTANTSGTTPFLYPLGTPTGTRWYGKGDGTVLRSSAAYGLTDTNFDAPAVSRKGKHAGLPKEYAQEIVDFLDEGRSLSKMGSLQTQNLPPTKSDMEEGPTSLVFQFHGTVQPLVTAPGGERLGIDVGTGALLDEFSGAVYSRPGYSELALTAPPSGNYLISFIGVAGEPLIFNATFTVGETFYTSQRALIVSPGPYQLEITLDTLDAAPLHVAEPFGSVPTLRGSPSGGHTLLQWGPVPDPAVVGYRIYGRRHGYRLFEFVAETPACEYLTQHPWFLSGDLELWSYVVVAVSATGKEGFWAVSTNNFEELHASFDAAERTGIVPLNVHFADTSTGTPSAWEWDFDADGIVDSTQQHPAWTYTTPGSYTVILKVSNSDATDVKVAVGYIEVKREYRSDFNFDGTVDFEDLAILADQWLGLPGVPNPDIAPATPDGEINFLDFARFVQDWLSGKK